MPEAYAFSTIPAKILLPIDFSPSSREALEQARALGVFSPFLVHVTEPSELPFGGW